MIGPVIGLRLSPLDDDVGFVIESISDVMAVSNSCRQDLVEATCVSKLLTRETVVREMMLPFWVSIQ